MQDAPKTAELADKVGISLSYASEIVNDVRNPSRPLAIHIFRKTGWRHKVLDGLTGEQLDVLEVVDPWRPDQQAAA